MSFIGKICIFPQILILILSFLGFFCSLAIIPQVRFSTALLLTVSNSSVERANYRILKIFERCQNIRSDLAQALLFLKSFNLKHPQLFELLLEKHILSAREEAQPIIIEDLNRGFIGEGDIGDYSLD